MKLSEIKESLAKMPEQSPETDDPYVVISNWGHGRQAMWPNSENPGVYTQEDAEKIVDHLTTEQKKGAVPGGGPHWHSQPLKDALEYVGFGNKAYAPLKALQKKYAAK